MRRPPTPSARPAPGVLEALADDLNTPKAIAEMHGAAATPPAARRWPARWRFFGFRASAFDGWRERMRRRRRLPAEEIESRIAARNAARARPRTSRNPIASATSSPRWASC